MATRLLTHAVVGTTFAFYTDDEIKRISVKRITNPQTFDTFGRATDCGLYDKALGPVDFAVTCPTCGLSFGDCPGHMGHIELNVPVYNPMLFTTTFRLLRLKCFACHKLRSSATRGRMAKVKLMLLELGRVDEALTLDAKVAAEGEAAAAESKKKKDEDATDMHIARVNQLLAALEMDCIAAGGSDVGCGLGGVAAVRYSQHVRQIRADMIDDFLKNVPSHSCSNCGAAAVGVRKDGYTKMFAKPVPAITMKKMGAMGISYRSATAVVASRQKAAANVMTAEDAAAQALAEHEEMIEAQLAGGGAYGSVATDGDEVVMEEDDEENVVAGRSGASRYMPVSEVAAHMQLLWAEDAELLRRVFLPVRTSPINPRPSGSGISGSSSSSQRSAGWQSLFLRCIAVPPPRFRPPTKLGDANAEHSQNIFLAKMIRLNDTLVDLGMGVESSRRRATDVVKIAGVDLKAALSTWMELQSCVNGLMDSSKTQASASDTAPNGIRQLLEKKEGMFRKNMMGKRVNFAARSVISPDPYLRTDQVGVPLRFAKTLTYRQPVTPWNVNFLRKLVINGADVWPGATHVEDEHGKLTDLSTRSRAQRETLAKQLLALGPAAVGGSALVGTGAMGMGGSIGGLLASQEADTGSTAAALVSNTTHAPGVKRVLRHMLDDDILLMNRQPTLHKPSIMAHRARVMRAWGSQQCIRFHYANCKTYNADFDGDEMNMHLPQDELGRAEAYTIVANPFQYLAPTSGAPLRGLIQDHNSISVLLTKRDQLLTRDQYCQLVFSALQALPQYGYGSGGGGGDGGHGLDAASALVPGTTDVPMLPPAILKPRPRWTGKQVISTVLHALSTHMPPDARGLYLDAKSKINDGLWGEADGRKDVIPVGDSQVIIRNNDMLAGVIDKNSLGNSSFGLVHAVYECYGPHAAGALLSATGRLLTVYLQWAAMTCGMDDLVLKSGADAQRKNLIASAYALGSVASAEFGGAVTKGSVDAAAAVQCACSPAWIRRARHSLRDRIRGGAAGSDVSGAAASAAAAALDGVVKGAVAGAHSKVLEACLPFGLYKSFPRNQFSLMVASGAKGSNVNHAMIAAGLGQQELEGRRVPMLSSGKTLPSFPAYDPSPRAGGYIADRFLTGLRPQDFFFHCMSGREGLVDTAVKTSRSGYLQRCLVKHLESLRVHYDYTVRDADGGVVQMIYGEDGMDVLNTPYLNASESSLTFIARNHGALRERFGIRTKAFREAAASFAAVSGTISAATTTLQVSRAILQGEPTVDTYKPLVLSVGDRVTVAYPKRLHDDGLDVALAPHQKFTFDGRALFTPDNLTGRYVEAVVLKVRTDDESRSVDVEVVTAVEELASTDTSSGSHFLPCTLVFRKTPLYLPAGKGVLPIVRPQTPAPLTSVLSPAAGLGVIPETLRHRLDAYVSKNPQAALTGTALPAGIAAPPASSLLSANAFQMLMQVKAMRSLVHPGEPVGVLAAQGVGEPSTQMTLNTFHLAGHGGANVTLGIPRLREIVMTASVNIKTPTMILPLLPSFALDAPASTEAASKVARALSPLSLSELLASTRPDGGIVVSESLKARSAGVSEVSWMREYAVRLYLADLDAIQDVFGLTFEDIISTVSTVFTPKMMKLIAADAKRALRGATSTTLASSSSRSAAAAADVGVERAKRDGMARHDAGDEDGGGDAEDGGAAVKRAAPKRAGAAQQAEADSDVENGSESEDDNAADGTLRVSARKQISGYDDVDEGASSGADEDGGRKSAGDSDDDDDGDAPRSSSARPTAQDAAAGFNDSDNDGGDSDTEKQGAAEVFKSMSKSKRSPAKGKKGKKAAGSSADKKKKRISVKINKRKVDTGAEEYGEEQQADAEDGNGAFQVRSNDKSVRDRRFGNLLACKAARDEGGVAWIQLTVIFPASARKVLMLANAEKAVAASQVRHIPGLTRAFSTKTRIGDKERPAIFVEGVNLYEMWAMDAVMCASDAGPLLDMPRLNTNDIAATLRIYGVEAARAAIVREMRAVFDVYGIGLDTRHLFLIADYMTQGGGYKPMNRAGMQTHASPYLRMTFETTLAFMLDAMMQGEHERMVSPSARIVMGRVVDSGTGCIDLWQPMATVAT